MTQTIENSGPNGVIQGDTVLRGAVIVQYSVISVRRLGWPAVHIVHADAKEGPY